MGIRSMFSGVSGLQSHSTWLDVIGNNISNTNTVAYKASRVHFADQISQTQFAGTGPNAGANLGGVNPQQVGLGTRVASIQTLFQQGPTLNTGLSTDIAIIGDGFMVAKSGSATLLTRAGNLDFDGNGNLVDQNGGLIQGWNASVEFTRRVIHTNSANGAPGMQVTDASLQLRTNDIGQVTNINVKRDFVLPPRATTIATFSGNLDSFQQANARGGILDMDPTGTGAVLLPWAQVNNLNGAYINGAAAAAYPGPPPVNLAIQQLDNFQDPALLQGATEDIMLINSGAKTQTNLLTGMPICLGFETLATAQGNISNAWEQQPPVPPAHVISNTVYDSLGNQRQLTIQFYQVNDLGAANVNTPPMSQVLYAWYAFDTTGGQPVSNVTLVGGTGIIEGDESQPTGAGPGYDRNVAGSQYWGDFVWFNTDGSLGNMGAAGDPNGAAEQVRPHIYLPPVQDDLGPFPVSPIPSIGAEIVDIVLDFGTPGMLGPQGGRRDGLYADAEGTYQFVNGVNTYMPNHTAFMKDQDGYRDGQLTGIQFDKLGQIIGSFTNGENVAIAQLVMAMPENQEGLSKVGGNYYATTANSGPMFVGKAGQLGVGTIVGNSLEGSNVDLTIELSNMIIAQRGFEVNARVISVTNSTLETVTRLGQ